MVTKLGKFSLGLSLLFASAGYASPWQGHNNYEEMVAAVQRAFPLVGAEIAFQSELRSYGGHKGTIAQTEKVGDDFFCDFQLREDFEAQVTIVQNSPVKITRVEPYMPADQEVSRVGVYLHLAETTVTGGSNPIELVVCIRNQHRDQIDEGWTLTKETSFTPYDISELLRGKATLTLGSVAGI